MQYARKRYVQPPRAKSFAPERLYEAPSKQLETNTTYHLSYLSADRRHARPQPIRPVHSLQRSTGRFVDETTNRLSYRPVWQIVKAEPVIPKRRWVRKKDGNVSYLFALSIYSQCVKERNYF